jgi:hypothetical protein
MAMTSDTSLPTVDHGNSAFRAKTKRGRRPKQSAPTIDRRTTSILFVFAFVLTFAISFGLFHYQETIASALSADGISWEVAQRGETSPVSSVPAVPRQRRFAVQVAAYESRAQAEALAQHLSTRHELVTVSPADINGKAYYRVRIPTETGADADRLAAGLRRELGIKAWVVYLP